MGLGLIIVGLAFFIVPSYGLIDVLPDFIGALLVVLGTSKFRDFNEDIEGAHGNFLKILFIDLAKFILSPLLYSFKDETTIMTFTLIFSIIEAILLFYALKNIMDGVSYLASRADSEKADDNANGTRIMCSVFVIASYTLLMLPQLVVLTNPKYSVAVDITTRFTLYDYRLMITIMCMLASLVLGIVFYSNIVKYLNDIKKEGKLKAYLEEKRLSSDEYEKISKVRNCKTSLGFIFAGFICTTSFYMEGIDLIPMALCFVLVFVGASRLKKTVKKAKLLSVISLVFSVVSLFTYGISSYIEYNFYRSLSVTEEISRLYTFEAICKSAEYIMLIEIIVLVCAVMTELIKKHTGREFNDEDSFQAKSVKKEKKSLLKRTLVILFSGIIVAVIGITASFGYVEKEPIWIAHAVLALIWALLCGGGFTKIYEAFENKYM